MNLKDGSLLLEMFLNFHLTNQLSQEIKSKKKALIIIFDIFL